MRGEELFASTTPGLEEALEREIAALGWQARKVSGGVSFHGSLEEANLRLRCASRVLLRLAEFPARNAKEVGQGLSKVSLSRVWDGRTPLRVRGVGALANECEQAAKKAWRHAYSEDAQEISIRLDRGLCTVSADTSGQLLHLRGYRQEIGRAPLRETLAAGMLVLAGYDGEVPLCDPLCGSGTLSIEGAWIATRRAPGLARTFSFERWPAHDAQAFSRLKKSLEEQQRAAPHAIFTADLNAGALGTARRNAKRAGVEGLLTLERKDVTKLAPPVPAPGLFVANLPYGKRVGERSELARLYAAVGATLRGSFSGWSYSLLLPADGPLNELGLSPKRVHEVDNGGIACRIWIG